MMQSKMIKIGDIVVKYRQKCGDPKAIAVSYTHLTLPTTSRV